MKLSEFIDYLNKKLLLNGDGDVYLLDECGCKMNPIVYTEYNYDDILEYRISETFSNVL